MSGRFVYLRVGHARLRHKRANFQHAPFVGYSCIYARPTTLHPLTQSDQIRHGNTYGKVRVLGRPRHFVCTNASRGLSAIGEFHVFTVLSRKRYEIGPQLLWITNRKS